MMHLGDITKVSGFSAPPVDVVISGSPCQDLSVAGKRAVLTLMLKADDERRARDANESETVSR